MVIVEGMDNTGKTTLVHRLAEDLKLLYINQRRKPACVGDFYKYAYLMADLSIHYSTIFDRWPSISDPIYAPICRGSSTITNRQLNDIHSAMQRIEPIIIYCRPPSSSILNFGDREQMKGVIEHAPELIQAYDEYMSYLVSFFPVVRYNYLDGNEAYISLKQLIINHLKGAKF